MPTVEEALAFRGPMASDLAEGVKAISENQEITFTLYRRLVLPLDGYVFWVRAQLVGTSAMYNSIGLNQASGLLNLGQRTTAPAEQIKVQGSLHYASDSRQEETESYTANRVVFTALSEVEDMNLVSPDELYIGEWQGLKFAFSSRGMFYEQAKLYHYVGFAVYPDMETQIIENVAQLDTRNVIVSNSLPIWLSLNGYQPFYGIGNPVTLYPSFLLPENLSPPFGSVHIGPDTTAIGGAPRLGPRYEHTQLVQDRVKVTLWGMRNFNALDFLDCVLQFSMDHDTLGIMNQPIIRDEKRTQNELNTIAQKKSVEFQVNYYQSSARNIARQLISSAIPTYIPRDNVA